MVSKRRRTSRMELLKGPDGFKLALRVAPTTHVLLSYVVDLIRVTTRCRDTYAIALNMDESAPSDVSPPLAMASPCLHHAEAFGLLFIGKRRSNRRNVIGKVIVYRDRTRSRLDGSRFGRSSSFNSNHDVDSRPRRFSPTTDALQYAVDEQVAFSR